MKQGPVHIVLCKMKRGWCKGKEVELSVHGDNREGVSVEKKIQELAYTPVET